jgi:hypothetical protein
MTTRIFSLAGARPLLYFFAAIVTACILSACGSGSDGTGGDASGVRTSNVPAQSGTETATLELFAEPISSAQVDLAWSSNADDETTTIYRVLRNGEQIAELTDATSFEDIGLRPSTAYSYAIEARDGAGNLVGQSAEASATTTAPDATPPEVVAASTDDGEPLPVNSALTVDFTAPMSEAQLNEQAFKVETRSGARIRGSVRVSGNSATFTPDEPLPAQTEAVASVAAGTTDVAGNAMTTEFATTFATAAVADTTRPRVSSTNPSSNRTGVATNTAISITFSEPMRNTTLTTANFRLRKATGTSTLAGTMKVVGNTAIFTPSSRLSSNTEYYALVTSSVRDAAGNALAATYGWYFTTGSATDTTAPRVSSTLPAANATGVAINTAIRATFSEPMKSTTLTTSAMRVTSSSGTTVTGSISVSGNSLQLVPSKSLVAGTRYTVTVARTVTDIAGLPMAATYSWSFTTASTTDSTAPRVTATSPQNGATGVATNARIAATFSEDMRDSTITSSSVQLANASGTRVTGTVTMSGNTVTFTPSTSLAGSAQYRATITTAVRDAAGNALTSAYSWSFTTVASTSTTVVAWDAVSASTLGGYRLYYGTSPGTYQQAKGQGVNVGKATSYTITGLTRGKRYYFAVTAYDTSNRESGYSNEDYKDIP